MSAAIKITRMDYTAAELRAVAAKCSDGGQTRRLLAIAMILDGASRLDAARQAGMAVRPCATGSIATMRPASTAWCRARHLVRPPN